jgi:hypothetical protein
MLIAVHQRRIGYGRTRRKNVCVQRRAATASTSISLVPVAQDRDSQQRARCIVVAEVPPHHFPGGEQVLTVLTGEVDRRLDNIGQVSTRGVQSATQVGHDPLRLSDHIADGDYGS